jgi:hypothetical protein
MGEAREVVRFGEEKKGRSSTAGSAALPLMLIWMVSVAAEGDVQEQERAC